MSMNSNNPSNDPVDSAHLLFLRGQLAEAREMLEEHIKQTPADAAARSLLDKIQRRQVQETSVHEDLVASARSLEWVENNFGLVVAAGIGLILFACYRAAAAIHLGSQEGFNTRIPYVVTTLTGKQYPNAGPLHNLLMFPVLHFVVGCGLLAVAFHYHRHASD